MIREHDWHGMPWYVLTKRYKTERGAIAALNGLHAAGKRAQGKLDLGVYRHGEAGSSFVATNITVVSHLREGVEVAEQLLAAGDDVELDPVNIDALIVRRARVVADLLDAHAKPGSYVMRRGRPARVNADGTFDEAIGEG